MKGYNNIGRNTFGCIPPAHNTFVRNIHLSVIFSYILARWAHMYIFLHNIMVHCKRITWHNSVYFLNFLLYFFTKLFIFKFLNFCVQMCLLLFILMHFHTFRYSNVFTIYLQVHVYKCFQKCYTPNNII